MRRAVITAWALLALLGTSVGCTSSSGDGGGGGASTTTTEPTDASAGEPVGTWAQISDDPCLLLPKSAVKEALDADKVALVDDPPAGSCRYRLPDKTMVELDLYPAMTNEALTDRTLGTAPGDDGAILRLDTPGAGVIVARGSAAALVAVRRPSDKGQAAAADAAASLAAEVAAGLPTAPKPSKRLLEQDACQVVPTAALEGDWLAGDAGEPAACGYRAPDGTRLVVRLVPAGSDDEAPAIGEPWPEAGEGATWYGVPGGAQSALGIVPVKGGHVELSLSSPVRGVSSLKTVALAAAGAISAAAGD